MTTGTDTTLRMTRIIKAAPADVFRAWTEPSEMRKWAAPEGVSVQRAEVDLTVGGKYLISMKSADGEYNAYGVYREVSPPSKLVYTWRWKEEAHDCGETLVTVEFKEMEGSTELILTHDLFPALEAKTGHEEGWTSCLSRFSALFAD
ncbi:MAG: SRPBCC domain-containing protein [Gemmatimonadota bacterium]